MMKNLVMSILFTVLIIIILNNPLVIILHTTYLELGATAIIYCSVSITRALHDHVIAMQLWPCNWLTIQTVHKDSVKFMSIHGKTCTIIKLSQSP